MFAANLTLLATVTDVWPVLTLTPPVFAIVLAIAFKDVNFALTLAILCGCLLLTDFQAMAAIEQLCNIFVQQLADTDHASVILFTVLLGSMISVMNDSGGTVAVVRRIASVADTRRKGLILTWLAGILVFFDDYANSLLVGSSVRPLTDRLQISREKLAFLIDATAAPIAGLALSTWTAFEIQQVELGLTEASLTANATGVFLNTIPYRIYPIATIIMVGVVACSGKDFGPMLRAEQRCANNIQVADPIGRLSPSGSIWTAVIPTIVLVFTVIALLYRDYASGGADWWKNVDSYRLLLLTSLAASASAVLSALIFRRMTLSECSKSWANGIESMIPAVVVLVLAWAISSVCGGEHLNTARFIVSLIGDAVRPELLPAIAFVAAGAMAAAVGSSFTTMGLLIPLFIPLAASVLSQNGSGDLVADPAFLATVGAILAGAIFGDHCSPISDTTVLSSAAAGCDHLQHVTTQVPYALIAAICSLLFGYLPIGFGLPWWIALPLSIAATIVVVLVLGRHPESISRHQIDQASPK